MRNSETVALCLMLINACRVDESRYMKIDLIDKQILGKRLLPQQLMVCKFQVFYIVFLGPDWSWRFRLKFKNGESVAIGHNTEILLYKRGVSRST